jgi:hypothetical protein
VAGLPHKVQLHREHHDQDLVVLTLNVEGAGKEVEAAAVLREREIAVSNFLLAEGMTDAAMETIDCAGVLPSMNLYDRRGKLQQLIGDVDAAELERLVQEALSDR